MTEFLKNSDSGVIINDAEAEAVYWAERDFLAQSTLVLLPYLPRSYAVGERLRDLRLGPDGNAVIRDISLSISLNEAPAQGSGAAQ